MGDAGATMDGGELAPSAALPATVAAEPTAPAPAAEAQTNPPLASNGGQEDLPSASADSTIVPMNEATNGDAGILSAPQQSRLRKACDLCHEGRLRCVMTANGKCEQCISRGFRCVLRPEKKRGRPRLDEATIAERAARNAEDRPHGRHRQKANRLGAAPLHGQAQQLCMLPPHMMAMPGAHSMGTVYPHMYPQGGLMMTYPCCPPGMPGMQPCMQAGMPPCMQPGMLPGLQPGMQPGVAPGMVPGMVPGMHQGTQAGMPVDYTSSCQHPMGYVPQAMVCHPSLMQPRQAPVNGMHEMHGQAVFPMPTVYGQRPREACIDPTRVSTDASTAANRVAEPPPQDAALCAQQSDTSSDAHAMEQSRRTWRLPLTNPPTARPFRCPRYSSHPSPCLCARSARRDDWLLCRAIVRLGSQRCGLCTTNDGRAKCAARPE
jgi:hypothetical protein